MERVKKGEGKLENGEESSVVEAELTKIFDKLLKSVVVASDNERAEMKILFVKTRDEEIHKQLKIDITQRDKLAAQETIDAYDFLKSVHFTISSRPVYHGFKRMSSAEFKELAKLAEITPAVLNNEYLKSEHKLTELQERIADAMIYEEMNLLVKCGSIIWQKAKSVGKLIGKFVAKIFTKSREETSGEQMKQLNKAKEEGDKLDLKRRNILYKAVKKIQEDRGCLKIREPIELAIYGDSDINGEKVIHKQEKKPTTTINVLRQDVQARLGAQALNSMVNTKSFPEGLIFFSLFFISILSHI
jgi:hypothetical protein